MIGAAANPGRRGGGEGRRDRKGGGAEPLAAIDRILAADARRREVEAEVNDLRAQRNAGNKQLGALDARRPP